MYNTNIKSRLGKPKGNVNRSQNGLSGRIGKKNLQSRLGTNHVNKTKGNQIQKLQTGTGLQTQALNISGADIRNKIIAKKRQNITDARDRLAEIAKSEDARVKLNKIKTIQPSKMQNNSLQVTAKGGIQKTVRNAARRNVNPSNSNQNKQNGASNGVRTGLDGKTSMKAGSLIRTVSGNSRPFHASARPLLNESHSMRLSSSDIDSSRYHPLQNNPNVVTIKNENASRRPQQNRSPNPQMRVNQDLPDYGHHIQSQAQQPYLTAAPLYGNYGGPVWVQQPMQVQEEIRPTQLRITTANNYMDYYQAPPQRYEEHIAPSYPPVPARPMPQKRSLGYDSYEEYNPTPPKKQELSSEIISRLDRPQRLQRPNANGFKIVVTNLHHVVTLEDVEELFGNIGPIKSARIVRDGVAEIFFLREDDAYRSVEVYHNRQLDGLPMNVTVVPRKNDMASRQLGLSRKEATPPNMYRSVPSLRASPPRRTQPSFNASVGNRGTKSVLRAAGGSVHDSAQLYNKRTHNLDVAPDISTIHQALFCGKGNVPLSNQQFYVKLPKPTFRK